MNTKLKSTPMIVKPPLWAMFSIHGRSSGGTSPACDVILCIHSACIGPNSRPTGMLMSSETPAPISPASSPTMAPSPVEMGVAWFCCRR